MTTPQYLNFLFYFLLITSLVACNKGEVKLELDNKEIYFAETNDTIAYRYENDTLRQRSQNIVTYTFTNTTNKKLLFVFDQHEIWPSLGISPTTEYYGHVSFTIRDSSHSLRRFSASLITWAAEGEFSNCELYNIKQKVSLYKNLGYKSHYIFDLDKFLNHSIVIYPGEKRTFKAIVNLPLVQEINSEAHKVPITYNKLEEGDTFELFYFSKAKRLKGILPKYILEELDRNNVEIYDGELRGPAVKLIKR